MKKLPSNKSIVTKTKEQIDYYNRLTGFCAILSVILFFTIEEFARYFTKCVIELYFWKWPQDGWPFDH